MIWSGSTAGPARIGSRFAGSSGCSIGMRCTAAGRGRRGLRVRRHAAQDRRLCRASGRCGRPDRRRFKSARGRSGGASNAAGASDPLCHPRRFRSAAVDPAGRRDQRSLCSSSGRCPAGPLPPLDGRARPARLASKRPAAASGPLLHRPFRTSPPPHEPDGAQRRAGVRRARFRAARLGAAARDGRARRRAYDRRRLLSVPLCGRADQAAACSSPKCWSSAAGRPAPRWRRGLRRGGAP